VGPKGYVLQARGLESRETLDCVAVKRDGTDELKHVRCADASLWSNTPRSSFKHDLHLFRLRFALLRNLDDPRTGMYPSSYTVTLLEERNLGIPMRALVLFMVALRKRRKGSEDAGKTVCCCEPCQAAAEDGDVMKGGHPRLRGEYTMNR
jgi:hypothetical protein